MFEEKVARPSADGQGLSPTDRMIARLEGYVHGVLDVHFANVSMPRWNSDQTAFIAEDGTAYTVHVLVAGELKTLREAVRR